MQAILFYLDVIAILIVVHWIYGVEQRGKSAAKGLLGMREPESTGVAAPMQPTTRWRQVEAPATRSPGGKPAAHKHPAHDHHGPAHTAPAHTAPGRPARGRPASTAPTPAWRRTLHYGRPPPKA